MRPQLFRDVLIEGSTKVDTAVDPTARPTNTVTDKMLGQADIERVTLR